jgi:hypothetical protein
MFYQRRQSLRKCARVIRLAFRLQLAADLFAKIEVEPQAVRRIVWQEADWPGTWTVV